MHAFLDHPRPIAIAHRGGSLEAEENTLPAFANAVRIGFTHVETDVHLTADGAVAIHHDPTLARMAGDPRAIAALSRAELGRIRTHGGAAIPLLSDLFEAHPDLFVNIEAKSDAVVEPLARLVRDLGVLDRICVGSFDASRTARLRALLGEGLCWSPAFGGVLGLWLAGWGLPFRAAPFRVVQVPCVWRDIPVVTPRFLRAAHRRGIQVQVWTVDDAADMHRLLDMGVDAIMTDRPTVLNQVLRARGQGKERHA
ncbi:MAG: glycerophosphodiester phosphodiesterase [Rhodobacter sp.]|uniref:glycerophosphodiester phosphodiesterase n=1 Tax=Pararhodobacter sp. TaxID=2127056 RepID=UPI002BA3D4A2|nr:glycerophosphodiester phosphodiesterase [Pararhodobacter sp.]MCC0073107.1 glycerophosphodiester phosphodiesterase [Rhodobacter sp.]HPD93720.1 glycerophosphodiester phosphodiesterase [Pararhodobacter sp.]